MSQAEIDAIELRLIGADHRPWSLSQERDTNGKLFICKGSSKAIKRAMREAEMFVGKRNIPDKVMDDPIHDQNLVPTGYSPRIMQRELCIFYLGLNATEDMANFVAYAPDDIEKLLNEVRWLRKRCLLYTSDAADE